MDYSENYYNLEKLMKVDFEKNSLSHTISKKSSFLPFKIDNTRPLFESGFYNLFGEFTRILLDKKIEKGLSLNNTIQDIINEDIIIDESNEEYFTKLINEYIFNEKNELKLSHPQVVKKI